MRNPRNPGKRIQLVLLYCGVRTGNFGAGSHIHNLIEFFRKQENMDLSLIKTDDRETDYLNWGREDNISVLRLPQPENKLYLTASPDLIQKTYARRLVEIIYPYIRDNENPIFLVNSIDYLNLAMELNDCLECRIVYVHHAWTWKDFYNVPDTVFGSLWKSGSPPGAEKAFEFTHYQQQLARLAEKVITVTQQARFFFSEILDISQSKVITIYNGISPSAPEEESLAQVRHSMGICQNEKIILFTGRIKAAKGLDYLIEAFLSLLSKISDARLVLIGSGDFEEFIPLAAPCWTRVTFTGKLSSKEILKWYRIADMGVLPSLHEQCSFTAIEMRFHKIPLIVSSVDGLEEMFTHEYDALKLSVQLDKEGKKKLDVAELETYMKRLLKDRNFAMQLAANGHKVALENFTVERMHQDYLKVLETMCEENQNHNNKSIVRENKNNINVKRSHNSSGL